MARDQVFISYSHADSEWLDRLQKMLIPLQRQGTLRVWVDTDIRPGQLWKEEIKQALAKAAVAVLLVSPDFLASRFIHENELPPLLEAAKKEGLTIIWIPLRACLYEDSRIDEYQPAYDPEKPLSSLPEAQQEIALANIARKIKLARLIALDALIDKSVPALMKKTSKRIFWEPFLRDVKIQILVGANLKRAPDRYMVAEWDYMTMAELVGFLSQEVPTLDIQIASPVYQKDQETMERVVKYSSDNQDIQGGKTLDDYLEAMIGGKNCILIGSSDINIVTEMTLAKAKDVCPFRSSILTEEDGFTGFVGFKSNKRRGFVHWQHRTFKEFSSRYNFIPADSSAQNTRDASSGNDEDASYTFYNDIAMSKIDELKREESETPLSEREVPQLYNLRYQGLYGYMAVFENPYTLGKRILVLSGISGPATMAMAQILTGCINSDITVNGLLCSSDQEERTKGQMLLEELYDLDKEEKKQLNEPEKKDRVFYGLLEHRVKRIKIKGNPQMDEKKKGHPSQEEGFLEDWIKTYTEDYSKDKTLANKKAEFPKLNYSLFSDGLLNELNNKIDSCMNVEALFYVVIADSGQSNEEKTLEWKDPRRILLWGFANCAAEDPTLDNPKKFVTAIQDIHREKQWPRKGQCIQEQGYRQFTFWLDNDTQTALNLLRTSDTDLSTVVSKAIRHYYAYLLSNSITSQRKRE